MADKDKTKTEAICEFLLTPEARGLSNAEIAAKFKADAGTVSRARKAVCGPNGGVLATLPIEALERDETYQLRTDEGGIDKDAVSDYASAYRRNEELPPILVTTLGGRLKVLAGFHRIAAALEVGLKEIRAEVVDVDDQFQALCLAAKSNAAHGKRFSRNDRRNAAQKIIAANPEFLEQRGGGRQLERLTGIDESFFRKLKKEILAARESEAQAGDESEGDESEAQDETQEQAPRGRKAKDYGGDDADGDGGEETQDDDAELTEEEKSQILVARQRHPILSSLPSADIRNLLNAPVFNNIHGDQLAIFVREYLLRNDEGVREALGLLKKAYHAAKPPGKVVPVLARQIDVLLKVRVYDHYGLCGKCAGKGCDACHRRGYC